MSRVLTNIQPTPVLEELVALASKHTGIPVTFRIGGQTYEEMDFCDAAEAYDNGYHPDPDTAALITENGYDVNHGPFFTELDRLKALVTEPLNEPILDDDYPVNQGHLYVANGKVRQFIDGMNMTVGRWKALRIKDVEVITEVRRCDIVGRQKRLPLQPERSEFERNFKPQMKDGMTITHSGHGQRRRKSRSSNKIKKVG